MTGAQGDSIIFAVNTHSYIIAREVENNQQSD